MTRWYSRFRTFFYLLGGLIILWLPVFIVFQACHEVEGIHHESARRNSREWVEDLRGLLHNQELGTFLLEERMERVAQLLSEHLSQYQTSPQALHDLFQRTLSRLNQEGIPIHFHGLMIQGAGGLGVGGFQWAGEARSSLSASSTLFMQHFLSYLCHEKAALEISDAEKQNLINQSVSILGTLNTITMFEESFLGKMIPGVIDGKAVYIYWRPILRTDQKARRLCMSHMTNHSVENRKNPGKIPQAIYRQLVLGGFAVIIPRAKEITKNPAIFVSGFDDRDVTFRFAAQHGSQTYQTPRFPRELLSGDPAAYMQAHSRYFLASSSLKLQTPYDVLIAAPLQPLDRKTAQRHDLVKLASCLFALAGTLIWGAGLFLDVGLTGSLGRQLWWGFTLAALTPIALCFLMTELFLEERLESGLKQARFELARELSFKEDQYLFHRARVINAMENVGGDTTLLQMLASYQNAPSVTLKGHINTRLMAHFDRLRQHAWKLRISLRTILISGLQGTRFVADLREEREKGQFSQLVGVLAERIIQDLNPRAASRSNTSSAVAVKDEIKADFAFKNLLLMFGPDGFFSFLYGHNRPAHLKIGTGDWNLLQLLIPAGRAPEFLFTFVHLAKYSDFRAIIRTLPGTDPRAEVFAFMRDTIGAFPFPEYGETYLFVRTVARHCMASGKRISRVCDMDGERYIVEANKIKSSPQFMLIGCRSEGPIRQEVEAMRGKMYAGLLGALGLALLLGLVSGLDLLDPLGLLQRGLLAIRKGRFGHRLPVTRADELGDMNQTFNEMARGLEEAELMEKMVSSSARKAVRQKSTGNEQNASVRQQITILYLGIPGFDHQLRTIPPRDLFEKLSRQAGIWQETIAAHAGDIDKNLGDKLLVVFSHADGPRMAAERALATVIDLFALEKNGTLPFPNSAGINSGQIIAGFLGTGSKCDYTVIGDPVNLAARAQSLAEHLPGPKLVISAETAGFLPASIQLSPLEVCQVKGKLQKVQLYTLTSLSQS
jgi:class 3 adenylate cyclase